jgi:hypothetical protein
MMPTSGRSAARLASPGPLQRLQYAFAAHIRDPEHAPAPKGIEDRRMAIYRELFFNNVEALIGGAFPVLRRILGKQRWEAMLRDWFVRHRARTPLFLELSQEFLHYLAAERAPTEDDPPFLLELAHYEWVELALSIDERELETSGVDPDGDLLAAYPVLSPLAWPLAYAWPVHRLSPDFQPAKPPAETTRLVVYRNRNDQIGFLEINLVTARLLELLSAAGEAPLSGRECLLRIATELSHPDPDAVVAGGAEILAALRTRDVLLGTAPAPA